MPPLASSVLLHRVSHRSAEHMPPRAISELDCAAVELLRDGIKQMPEKP